jgi:hypothetical protein
MLTIAKQSHEVWMPKATQHTNLVFEAMKRTNQDLDRNFGPSTQNAAVDCSRSSFT